MSTNEAPRFDVHDRVQVVCEKHWALGEKGRVVGRVWDTDKEAFSYLVDFDWGFKTQCWIPENQLERVK